MAFAPHFSADGQIYFWTRESMSEIRDLAHTTANSPTSADLDAVAEEQRIKELTEGELLTNDAGDVFRVTTDSWRKVPPPGQIDWARAPHDAVRAYLSGKIDRFGRPGGEKNDSQLEIRSFFHLSRNQMVCQVLVNGEHKSIHRFNTVEEAEAFASGFFAEAGVEPQRTEPSGCHAVWRSAAGAHER